MTSQSAKSLFFVSLHTFLHFCERSTPERGFRLVLQKVINYKSAVTVANFFSIIFIFKENAWLVGWLFWALRPFQTVFKSTSGRLPKIGRKIWLVVCFWA